MKKLMRSGFIFISLSLLFFFQTTPVFALDPIFTNFFGQAIRGYDPVAYFKEGQPVEGDSDFQYEWKGAKWYFASQENLDAFIQSPESYAPQYGGYCAWAVSQGYTASIDPEAWHIREGKLYLNYSKGIQKKWLQDVPGNILNGDRNWPKLIKDS